MYLRYWKRTIIFKVNHYLRDNDETTYYMKELVYNPELLDFWNFFVHYKKFHKMIDMIKEVGINSLISLEGDNALEIALSSSYLPLVKAVLKYTHASHFRNSEFDTITIMSKVFNSKIAIYKEILLCIKNQKIEYLFSKNDMLFLIKTDINKMIYFEKIFPGLFLKLYNEKIDSLHPHFQYFLLNYDKLKTKLSRKFKKKNIHHILNKI